MKSSLIPSLYTLPRRERDPMGAIFPSIGVGDLAGSCVVLGWRRKRSRVRSAIKPRSAGRSSGMCTRPTMLVVWASRYDHAGALWPGDPRRVRSCIRNRRWLATGLGIACRPVHRLASNAAITAPHRPLWLGALGVAGRGPRDRAARSRSRCLRWRLVRSAIEAHEVPARRELDALPGVHADGFGKDGRPGHSDAALMGAIRRRSRYQRRDLGQDRGMARCERRSAAASASAFYKFEPTATDGSSVRLNPFDRIRIGTAL